ncbi:MAG: hypothetical protein ACI4S2_01535 [Lachnospiraceae bacterium]
MKTTGMVNGKGPPEQSQYRLSPWPDIVVVAMPAVVSMIIATIFSPVIPPIVSAVVFTVIPPVVASVITTITITAGR